MKTYLAPKHRSAKLKKLCVSMGLAVALATPSSAFALQSLVEIALTKAAEYAQVLAKQAAMLASWTYDKTQNLLASQSSTESIVASIEKHLAGSKELTQAQANYDAANSSRLRFESAQDNFTSESAQGFKACETLAENSSIGGSSEDTKDIVKASTQAAVQRGLHTENANVAARAVLLNYKNKYCSDQDVQRGFCTSAVAPLMQGASLHAGSLLIPAANETYSEDETMAAKDFIDLLTNPNPDEMLPKGLERKNGPSQAFNLALMNGQAQMSVAVYSLNEILASRTPATAMSSTAAGESEGSISAVGLMKIFAEKRFSDPEYKAKINGMLTPALLQEFNLQMAARNWMDFQSYLQDERIEVLVATRLGILAGERNDRQLALARSTVKAR